MKKGISIVAVFLLGLGLCRSIDLNGNGLSDVWEFIYFAGPADPDADTDGDGSSNYKEMMWGTSPTNASSQFTGPVPTLNGSDLSISWCFASNRVYTLQASTNLLNWDIVDSGAISSHVEHLVPPGMPPWRFFRLQVTMSEQDADGDGLADWEGALWRQAFGQPLGLTDIDGDGLSDTDEFVLGRNPGKKDHPAVGLIVFTPLEK